MERLQDKRLQEIRDSGKEVYSFSRLSTINNCLYEAYMTYVLKERGKNNIYGILGGKIHDILEGIVNNVNTEADLLPAMQEELDDMESLGISFPKDFRGGDSIRDGWVTNMTHFCNTYKSPKGKNLHTEELFIYETPKHNYVQGYIDLYSENKDGTISIYDYKTSTMYSGNDLLEHGRQLITYLLGKEQEGFKVKNVAWIFLKYVDVEYMGYKTARSKEKTLIKKSIERKKIGSEMYSTVENDLINAGYDEIDTDIILNDFKNNNDFGCLPENIRNNYKVKPCVLNYEITEDIKNECIKYIDDTIEMWESLDKNNEFKFTPRSFTKINKSGKEVEDTFFCGQLCGHGCTCRYLHDYLNKKELIESDDDLF